MQALELAIALSQRSNHPISRALTALDGLLDQSDAGLSKRISDFRAVPGEAFSMEDQPVDLPPQFLRQGSYNLHLI